MPGAQRLATQRLYTPMFAPTSTNTSPGCSRSCNSARSIETGTYQLTLDPLFGATGSATVTHDPGLDLGVQTKTRSAVGGNDAYEVFDYPGSYQALGAGDKRVQRCIEGEECATVLGTGPEAWEGVSEAFVETHAWAPCGADQLAAHLAAAGLTRAASAHAAVLRLRRAGAPRPGRPSVAG